MASQVLKCTSCNIVINEVLAFICNKIDVMDEQSISQICVTAFSESDIVDAKNLLFDSVSSAKRKKTRRRDGKSARDIDDIITLLKESDSAEIPTFVARDLHKLPPILFDHIDPTQVLKDLLLLKSELNTIKSNYATKEQIDILKTDVELVKSAQGFGCDTSCNINLKRGGCLIDSNNLECNSGPIGLMQEDMEQVKIIEGTIEKGHTGRPSYDSLARTSRQPDRAAGGHAQQITRNLPVPIRPGHTDATNSAADLPSKKLLSDVVRDSDWKVVQNKKPRYRFKGNRGNAIVVDSKFKAAEINIPIYIYNVSKEVTMSDIENYVFSKTGLRVTVEKNIMKLAKEYDGYKIYIPKHKLDVFMTNDFWPEGIAYRRFIDFRHRKASQDSHGILKQ